MRVGVTGATGFIGSALLPLLLRQGHAPVALTRRHDPGRGPGVEERMIGPLESAPDLAPSLRGLDAVIHLAGLAHRPRGSEAEAAYEAVNVLGTQRLAQAAAQAGVPRLVFASTLLVHGDESPRSENGRLRATRPDDPPRPADAYARSKWRAEGVLLTVARDTGLAVAIVRPPLVHGPGAKGNLAALMRAIRRGVPLPLASVENRRSLLGVENLADLLAHLATRTAATGAFLAADGEDVSTPDLVRRLAAALHRPPRLLPCPPSLIRGGAAVVGRPTLGSSLTGSLFVDSAAAAAAGWRPAVTLDEGLRAAALAQPRQGAA